MRKEVITFFVLIFIFFPLVSADFVSIFLGNEVPSEDTLLIIKYALTGLVIILIIWILNSVKIPENGFFRFIISIAVGFLATAFFSPGEVYAILIEYMALVFAIIAGLVATGIYLVYRRLRKRRYSFGNI